jgi:hypothetical protein
MSRIRLDSVYELGSSPRMGGNFRGLTDATIAIWKGRPPTTVEGLTPNILSISMRSEAPLPVGASRTVTIKAECGNGFGGIITREFDIGEGLSCDLGAGAFQHVKIRTASPIPENCILYFCWVHELNFSSSVMTLSNFLDYPVANTRVRVPEGAFQVMPESACQITWTLDRYGTTFVQGVAAGQSIPVRWGTFSCNVPNKFFFRLRGF